MRPGIYHKRCDCGNVAEHELEVSFADVFHDNKSTSATMWLCDACWQLEQQQAAGCGGRGEWQPTGILQR
jgi:hypothetical protein